MITSEGNQKHDELIFKGDGYSDVLSTNGNGGVTIKRNQHTNFISNISGLPTYNVGFGSTLPTAAWVEWTAQEAQIAGVDTSGYDPTKPKEVKTFQIDVEASNIWTTQLYGQTGKLKGMEPYGVGFFDLYEKNDERKARHKALRNAGFQPPFPRADRFYQNKHLGNVQAGLTTEGSY